MPVARPMAEATRQPNQSQARTAWLQRLGRKRRFLSGSG